MNEEISETSLHRMSKNELKSLDPKGLDKRDNARRNLLLAPGKHCKFNGHSDDERNIDIKTRKELIESIFGTK